MEFLQLKNKIELSKNILFSNSLVTKKHFQSEPWETTAAKIYFVKSSYDLFTYLANFITIYKYEVSIFSWLVRLNYLFFFKI